MRIVLTGSHSVGKSTLVRQLLGFLNETEYKTQEDVMRIATTGSQGVGKTTLAKLIAGKAAVSNGKTAYRYLPEAAFAAYQAGFRLNERSSKAAQLWMMCKQLEMEQGQVESWQMNWVSDRCMIDILAYTRHFFPDDRHLLAVVEEIAEASFKRYDLVLYLPAGEFPIEDDGFRSTNALFQAETDLAVRQVLEDFEIIHHRITGTVIERFEQVKKLIK